MRKDALFVAALLTAALVAVSCGDGGQAVTSEIVSNETTSEMLVFAPQRDAGAWPVIVAYHGIDGTAQDMAEIATRLAAEGSVVFAPTYSTDFTTLEGFQQAGIEAECGYRFARSLAADYGGDLDRPVTLVGWSLGASAALGIGLSEDIDPSGEVVSCFENAPRPDIVVAISGCHYEGGQLDLVDTEAWGNEEAEIILLAGENDTNCPPSQTEDAATELDLAGYDVTLEMLAGANHFAPVFHDSAGGQMVLAPEAPAGERIVEVVMDAIDAR